MSSGPLYEKTILAGADRDEEFRDWLERHVADIRSMPGVTAADVSTAGETDDKRLRYTLRAAFDSDESLDVFLEREANESFPGPVQVFGDAVDVSSRVLREDRAYGEGGEPESRCLNCGAALRGQYCGNCGQRARGRLISLWELVRDAFGDLFELDSRLWQTLIPLLVRPGRLTHDYLAGRRARYMPPFRMYLVLSLVFFVVAFFNPREELALLYVPDEAVESAGDEDAVEPGDAEIAGETQDALEAQGVDVDELNRKIAEAREESEGGVRVQFSDSDGDEDPNNCQFEDWNVDNMPRWIQLRFSKERVTEVCQRIVGADDGGREFGKRVLDNIPVALFVLLPLMAIVLKLLYPLSRRYYVEHLLFFVHFHAFFFLMLTLQVLWVRTVNVVGGPEWLGVLPVIAASFYIPVYLFKSMRQVYGQGWLLTMFKYLVLLTAYASGFLVMLTIAFLFAVLAS
jgi:hypothetical protein